MTIARGASNPAPPDPVATRAWRGRVIAGVALGGVLASSCQRAPAPAPAATLTIATRADVTGFFPNPPITNESFTLSVNWNVLEGLVRFDSELQPRAALAESWHNPDDSTYVFKLRRGVRFSDGRPLRAADVAASLRAARERAWVTQDALQAIAWVEADGDERVIVHTRFPYRLLMYRLPFGFVLPAEALERSPVPLVGTGPYQLESWEPGRAFVLVANPHYYGRKPGFTRVQFRVVPDEEERLRLLRGGAVQLIDNVPLEQLTTLQNEKGLQVFAGPSNRVLFLVLRADEPPFSDPRVREAFDLAIDRDELVEHALYGRAQPASQLVPASILGYNPELRVTRPDRDRARRLLVAAGYAKGLDVRLDGPMNRYVGDRAILDEVARQLALVGVNVRVNALDKRDLFELATRRGSSFTLMGWASASGEAGTLLESRLHTTSPGRLGNDNTGNFSDPVLDDLIERNFRAATLSESRRLLQQALARAAEMRPLLPLVVQFDAIAVSHSVRWRPSLDFMLDLDALAPATAPPTPR